MPNKKSFHLHELMEKLLRENPRLRENTKNSNWMLTFKVLQEIAILNNKHIYLPFEMIENFPSFESIAREKRDILNKKNEFNDFEPDPNIKYFPKQSVEKENV